MEWNGDSHTKPNINSSPSCDIDDPLDVVSGDDATQRLNLDRIHIMVDDFMVFDLIVAPVNV